VLVVNFSAAPSDTEVASAKAMIADIFNFINIKPDQVEDYGTLSKFKIYFNELTP